MTRNIKSIRNVLTSSVALAAIICTYPSLSVAAEIVLSEPGSEQVTTSAKAEIEERQQYMLRLMTQIYDGKEDFSHTQMLGVGRVRKGNISISKFDFGNGSVVIDPDAVSYTHLTLPTN